MTVALPLPSLRPSLAVVSRVFVMIAAWPPSHHTPSSQTLCQPLKTRVRTYYRDSHGQFQTSCSIFM